MSEQESMSLKDFFERFGTEEKCRGYLHELRWLDGFSCPKCGIADKPFNISCRNLFQCKQCSRQTSVTAGTIFDKSRTPLSKWFLAIYLVSCSKRRCSALRLMRELGISYGTAWAMSHKIRIAVNERDGSIQQGLPFPKAIAYAAAARPVVWDDLVEQSKRKKLR